MRSDNKVHQQALLYAGITTICSIVFALLILAPLWTALKLHVPYDPTRVDFTYPVDAVFYIKNAEDGYRWKKPESVWFHPAIPFSLNLIPFPISVRNRLWLLSIVTAFFSLFFVWKYTCEISDIKINPAYICLVALLPGSIVITTGNAEIPCLLFSTLLLISISKNCHSSWIFFLGVISVLTKPNALYLIFGLGAYLYQGITKKNKRLIFNSVVGIGSIILAWRAWIFIVDVNSGQFGTYDRAREVAIVPLNSNLFAFLERFVGAILTSDNSPGETLRFLTALVIPIIDLWLLLFIPIKNETHRISIALTITAMLLVMFMTNNPNKIIVYSVTFPGHLAVGLLFLRQAFEKKSNDSRTAKMIRRGAGCVYILFCAEMILFFIIGTPLEWYV